MMLFCDCKTDEEKSNFFLSGKAVETGVVAPAISNEVAMAYHKCVQLKKENEELRAKITEMEKQEPVAWLYEAEYSSGGYSDNYFEWRITRNKPDLYGARKIKPLYTLPGAQPELNLSDPVVQKRLATQWGYVQKPHPDCDEGCMFQCAQNAPSVSVTALRPVIAWLRNGCDTQEAAKELEILIAATEAKP